MADVQPEPLDRPLIAHNVRWARIVYGHTQEEMALRTGISVRTLAKVENGEIVRTRTIERIAKALGMDLGDLNRIRRTLNMKHADQPYALSRWREIDWSKGEDRRRTLPPNDPELIQSEEERLRLGSNGLVAHFAAGLTFAMPRGPGMAFLEIYDRSPIEAPFYHDCFLCAFRGSLRITVEDDSFELHHGDVVGYETRVTPYAEPLLPLGRGDLPPLLQWIGANRVGQPALSSEAPQPRVRRKTAG